MDILKIIDNLRTKLWVKYGNPLDKYKKTQGDINMSYYLGRLMEELKHDWILPSRIKGERENCVYYSERALQDAFLAGQLLAKADHVAMRKNILESVKIDMADWIENYKENWNQSKKPLA